MLFDEVQHEELQEKIELLKRQLGVDSEDLGYKWEAWVVKNSLSDAKLDTKTFQQFEADMLDSLSRPKKKIRLNTPNTGRSLISKTPARSHGTPANSDIPSSPRYDTPATQTDAGTILIEEGSVRQLNLSETDLSVSGAEPYNTGHVKIAESTDAIDRQIEWFMSELVELYEIAEAEICNPASITQQESWAVGRIICDKRLGPDSISLQTCRKYGGGTHIPLDPVQLNSFSFFPGQLVAFKGTNPNGEKFIAKQQFTLKSPVPEGKNGDTSVVIAAGPFTTRSNLDYQPLSDLVKVINEEMPSAAILVGPFIDPTHPVIVSGDVGTADSLTELFLQRVTPILSQIQVPCVLIPGLGDEVGGHVPFPQPSLSKKQLKIPEHMRCAGNPAEFQINGTVFSTTSIDPIQDIARTRYEKGSPSLSRPFKHILDQRNLYPVFPAPRPQVSVDIAHMERAKIGTIPHVLVASSTVRPVVEDFDGVLCVNPGLLCKGLGGGTYAKLRVGSGDGPITGRYNIQIVQI